MNEARNLEIGDRQLPASPDTERAILGAIILDNALVAQAAQLLDPTDFYVLAHRRIFRAMVVLFARHVEIDPITLANELRRTNELESSGGIIFITNLTSGLPHVTSIERFAEIVKGKALLRELIHVSQQNIAEAFDGEDLPQEILDRAESRVFQLAEQRMHEGFTHVQPIAGAVLERVQGISAGGTDVTGLPTGLADLDELTSGFQKKDLIIIAARPSVGKTALALTIARNVVAEVEGAVVGMFSLEMSKAGLAARLICSQAGVDAHRFRNARLDEHEWRALVNAFGELADAGIYIDDTARIGILEMRAKARRLAAEQGRLDLLIVDYLQLMAGTRERFESRQQEVSEISRELKALAKEMDVPLLALSQLSRAPEHRSNHRPQLADLRESGTIEQDADLVAFIYRAEAYMTKAAIEKLPEEERNIAELIIAKQRNGPTDTVYLRWTNSSTRFDTLYLPRRRGPR